MRNDNITPWAKDVVKVLIKLGGKATTSEIAINVKTTTDSERNTKDWRNSVRNVLNDYCDSKVNYKRIKSRKPNHPALFVDLDFKGREKLWGLKQYKQLKNIVNI
jgi:hypothetical protein